jgi:predicted dehydrogenase
VEVVAVCDRSAATAEAAAERAGVPKWYTDHRVMLSEARPDVVHVTTPAPSHFSLTKDALEAGAHVLVEKPATEDFSQLGELDRMAAASGLMLTENHNYVFNRQTQEILHRVQSGVFGLVMHVDVMICLDIITPGGTYSDPNVPHASLRTPAGAIGEFLTHLASLAYVFVGPHREVHTVWTKRSASQLPNDEFRAIIDGDRGTASLVFSANTQPDAFWLRVYGEKGQAVANLFETRLTFDILRGGSKPLRPLLNGLREGRDVRHAAVSGLWRKLSGGPGAYEGLWKLIDGTYLALSFGGEPPVPRRQVFEVNRLVADLKPRSLLGDES